MTFYVTHREAQDRGSARQAGWGGPRPSLAPALLRTARGRIERSGGRPGWPARWPPALAAPVAGPGQPRARLARKDDLSRARGSNRRSEAKPGEAGCMILTAWVPA